MYDDALFSHTVDETLGFDRELRDICGYPESLPSAVTVLTQAQVLVKWIHMERKCKYWLLPKNTMMASLCLEIVEELQEFVSRLNIFWVAYFKQAYSKLLHGLSSWLEHI